MLAYVNGRVMPEQEATISIFDRGFLYGDAIFELIRVYGGRLFLWDLHRDRWEAGCKLLRMSSPLSAELLRGVIADLVRRNETKEGLVRVTLSRGVGARGYSPKTAVAPSLVVTVHPVPERAATLKVVTSSWRLQNRDPLAGAKHANKLLQVLARAEADEKQADEALLLNDRGEVVEGTSSNLFWVEGETVHTAPLEAGVLPGTTRAFVLELARQTGCDVQESRVQPARLLEMDGVFLTSTAIEIAEVGMMNGKRLKSAPITGILRKAYRTATEA